ncbi:U-box domain-containing protein 33-like [Cucurbita moschata]|uniref:RING-type E3 ubiquitin transferase n=1 Tax=Cucurbita moschata TaxID=3662 RepID=A0A6J1GBJ3_CUCMO|nr:U-box domain-containing protein 33-like [Cucurbita moschata]
MMSAVDYAIEDGGAVAGDDEIFVAVGKSVGGATSVLQWTLRRFPGKKVRLLHVHHPSLRIPTLFGKLAANQVNAHMVAAYRKKEWAKTIKILSTYLSICSDAKVRVSFAAMEADHVGMGIVDLVDKLCIKRLVMGTEVSIQDNFMKINRRMSKTADYTAKNASSLCEIWFINKGKLVSTRQAAKCPSFLMSQRQHSMQNAEKFSPSSFQCSDSENKSFSLDFIQSCSTSISMNVKNGEWIEGEVAPLKHEMGSSSEEATKNLELLALEAMNKAKVIESTCSCECKLRQEAEFSLRTTIQEKEKLISEREQLQLELWRTLKNIALLDCQTQRVKLRQDEAAKDLELIQVSVSVLWQEKQKFKQQKAKALHWLERWKSGQAQSANCRSLIGFVEELPQLDEFSLSEIQTATCNFSESFRIGQAGYECMYKGEMMGRTVAISKLHPHSMLQPSEFQQEAYVLGELRHPHLVTLLGVCTEAWSLIYEYLPNGSLQNHLFSKGKTPLTWRIRARIVADISSALCFLHSSKPENLVHGDLKPENILLDSQLSCKIGHFGIRRLVSEEFRYFQSLPMSTVPKGAFSYTDPEFQRTKVLTPLSDVYSFGLIILQLLTGKPAVGLASEVRNALSSGQLELVLDSSAGEWPETVATRLVDFALQCCELKSRDRPKITPVIVRELEQLYVSEERPVPPYFLCPILQEIMQDPHVAADGFTYEGEAIHSWLKNGRETSPMTNLRLNHLQVTPNHTLRLAIHNWLCKS